MPCWVQTESTLLASQPRTCWSPSDFCSIRRIAPRPHCIPVLICVVLLSLVYLPVRSSSETSSLRGSTGKYGGNFLFQKGQTFPTVVKQKNSLALAPSNPKSPTFAAFFCLILQELGFSGSCIATYCTTQQWWVKEVTPLYKKGQHFFCTSSGLNNASGKWDALQLF